MWCHTLNSAKRRHKTFLMSPNVSQGTVKLKVTKFESQKAFQAPLIWLSAYDTKLITKQKLINHSSIDLHVVTVTYTISIQFFKGIQHPLRRKNWKNYWKNVPFLLKHVPKFTEVHMLEWMFWVLRLKSLNSCEKPFQVFRSNIPWKHCVPWRNLPKIDSIVVKSILRKWCRWEINKKKSRCKQKQTGYKW